ncbi:cytochrome b/b6 domain-containing protein [Tropicimonas marinistellae]|uniref:cytochrome b/b6 domain-containing protein n=1 Tax=Tropicimonas marinistellae TaxID=1739787 RepID=UPI000834B41A|nr:cytochrome b/b6 domain-containing protein [Tropicimonas marinistellae]
MTLANTEDSYGLATRLLHWLTAALILVLLPLGLIAEQWPYETAAQLAQKMWLFSLHKTLGVAVFFVALTRLVWMATQTRPRLLNGDKPLEAGLAETIHTLLYIALVATPLTGWIHHAASEGFAPIWWPLGQSLPLVPKSEPLSAVFSGLHLVSVLTLVAALGLHVAGALKHHVIDRDATLRRMVSGVRAVGTGGTHTGRAAGLAALAAAMIAVGGGAAVGLYAPPQSPRDAEPAPIVAETGGDWLVSDGTLAITVSQMGSDVSGTFADWNARIDFSETPVDGSHGTTEVTIAIGSLTLGSVTEQAMGADYFNVAAFPTATFRADLRPGDDGTFLATGSLTLRGAEVPVDMPFTLQIDGDTATMNGSLTLDRRDFHIGDSQTNAGTLGFDVAVNIALTADRSR